MSSTMPGAPVSRRHWRSLTPGTQRRRPDPRNAADPGAPDPASRRRRILLINQHYWPDHASTGQHLTDLAESLADQGHDVHVVCSRRGSRPGAAPRARREVHNRVHVHRVGASGLGRSSTFRRMTDYLSFHATAMLRALTLPRPDLVVTLTTPPLVGLIGLFLKRLRGTKHVYWSMDLHPDASLALGRMNPRKPWVRALRWLSDFLYRQADRVVSLGPYMTDLIRAKGVPSARISMIPVWSRRDEVYPLPREGHPLRESLGLADRFVVMYSGNHGLAHSFDEFIEAARLLADRPEIVFLFVGDGPRRAEVVNAREEYNLENIHLLDFFPRDQLHASLSLADAHLVSLRPEMRGVCVPGKIYGAMASERPILFVGPNHCEIADTLRNADCGRTFVTGDGSGLAATIAALSRDPVLTREMGERGLAAFASEYDREACCAQWCWMIDDLSRTPDERDNSDGVASEPARGPRAGQFAPDLNTIGSRT